MSVEESAVRTLAFGGSGSSDAPAVEPVHPAPAGGAPRAGRSAAKRARQRRRAAQRRSRVRMREGSEPLLAFLVLLGLTMLLVDLQTDGSAYAGARSAATSVVGPLQTGIDQVLDPARSDADLRAENERLQSDLAATAADAARLRELEGLLGLVGRSGHKVVAASVVALDAPAGTALTATIDRGTADGLAVDQAVLAEGGLAGLVLTVAPHTAVVRLAADPEFAVGARLTGSGAAGIVRGTGEPGRLTMELLDPLAAVAPGELVATFGSPGEGPFPPGLAVGSVTEVGDPASVRRMLQLQPSSGVTEISAVAVVVMRAAPDAEVVP